MGHLELSMPVKEVQTSLIRLEMETQGKVTFVKMVADGEISDIQLVNNDFEALSGHGTVFITLQNVDIIVGEFGLWINCEDLTVVPVSKQLSLPAGRYSDPLEFKIYSEMDQGANYTCKVTLFDADDALIEERTFDVLTRSTIHVNNFEN